MSNEKTKELEKILFITTLKAMGNINNLVYHYEMDKTINGSDLEKDQELLEKLIKNIKHWSNFANAIKETAKEVK